MHATIRSALESDAEPILCLMGQFLEYLRDLGNDTESRFTADAYRRDGFGPDPAFSGLVAESDRGVVGYLLYRSGYDIDRAARTLEIIDLFVTAGHRRHGVGRALMARARRLCEETGARALVWAVYRWNTAAHAFYESLGARYVENEHYMYIEIPETAEAKR